MIGLGITTYGRPETFEIAMAGVEEHLALDVLVVDDAPGGVTAARNRNLRALLDAGCDWLFLMEDDVEVLSPEAVTGYIAAAEASDLEHLMFHRQNQVNMGTGELAGPVTCWPDYAGCWLMYSRRSLEVCGLFDEAFRYAFDHVEHSIRLGMAGFTSPWRRAADATGSEEWLRPIPSAGTRSQGVAEALDHWQSTYPESFALSVGPLLRP